MRFDTPTAVAAIFSAVAVASASRTSPLPRQRIPRPQVPKTVPVSPTTTVPNITTTTLFFDQLLDHNNPSAGTFKQRFFFSEGFYTGPGAPIVISNPGEQSADGFEGYLTVPASLQYAMMEDMGAAGIVLEHRYWGQSSPYQDLTTDHMKYLNVDQAVEDNKYFLENVKLPLKTNSTHPAVTPWVNSGCSYPGVLSAYTQEKHSDIFAAAWASSGPVQAQANFWEYFEPIEEGMPKNCSSDVALVLQTIDKTLLHGTAEEKLALKKSFGLDQLDDVDFADALPETVYSWQDMEADSYALGGEDFLYQWCDAIETLPGNKTNYKAEGVGMPLALNNWANFWKTSPALACPAGQGGGACYSTANYTSDYYTNMKVDNPYDRQWTWMVCTEFGWFQGGDPGNSSSIVSAVVTDEYVLNQCNHMFLNKDGSPGDFKPATAQNNAKYGGWDLKADHLFVVNGQYDPWRSASLSSDWAPKPPQNTPTMQTQVVADGHHCWDWDLRGAAYDPDIKRVVDIGIPQIKAWVTEWYKAHPAVKNSMPKNVDYWANVN